MRFKMKKEDFERWSEKRESIVTPENFSTRESFQATVDSLPKPVNVTELNPSIPRLDFIEDVLTKGAEGFFYARTDHNNYSQLEKALTDLEVGRLSHPDYFGAKVFPCGMAAIASALRALSAKQDGVFIHGPIMYSSTKDILADKGTGRNPIGTLPGIQVDLSRTEDLESAIKSNKSQGRKILGVIIEPVANPTTAYTNTRDVAEVAHAHGIPVIVDNTFLTPSELEPFRMGADVVIHSLTKYFSGMGDMTGGVVIAPKEIIPYLQNIRKNEGTIMSIKDAYDFALRVPHVAEYMEAHSKNAKQLADTLRNVEGISVNYTDLTNETRTGRAGGVLSFVFDGGSGTEEQKIETAYRRGRAFDKYLIDNEDQGVIKHAVSLAEPKTLSVTWPGQLSLDRIKDWNVPAGLVRVSPGREQDYGIVIDYILEGIKQSL
jgi:methionine-gamma-lyase